MRWILLSCAALTVLAASSAAAAPGAASATRKPGFLVLRKASSDGRLNGRPVVTLVIHGFVLGSVGQREQARVDIYQLPSAGGGAPTAVGADASRPVKWHGVVPGREFSGNGFRFRAVGGYYRVVVRGSGLYLFAGGHDGNVKLRGSSFAKGSDGRYSIDGGPFRSLPTRVLKRQLG